MQADNNRDALVKFYGQARGQAIRHAQAFEICEYGRQPTQEELKQLFPYRTGDRLVHQLQRPENLRNVKRGTMRPAARESTCDWDARLGNGRN